MPRRHSLVWGVFVAALAAVGVWVLLQVFVGQIFTVSAASMRPTLDSGDRVLVLRPTLDRDPRRGDVVVVDVRGTFIPGRATGDVRAGTVLAPAPADSYVVKRVIAGPGDRLQCCTAEGRLMLNGEPLDEPYLRPGSAPATEAFDIAVPPGRWWIMGDNRDVSEDSRAHLGSPGGGTVSTPVIIGRVVTSW